MFKTFDEFVEKTGMIIADEDLRNAIKGKKLESEVLAIMENDDSGRFDANWTTSDILRKFCASNPEFHIVSTVDAESSNGILYDNCVRFVNRINYYLALGDKDIKLFYLEDFDG